MAEHVLPNEHVFYEHQNSSDKWTVHPLMEELKVLSFLTFHCHSSLSYLQTKAQSEGLWNLFLPIETDGGRYGAGLTNLEYAHLCEIMGRSVFAPEVIIMTIITV